jgi:3-oxoacyl-[acyl-carrier-protein] synthase II
MMRRVVITGMGAVTPIGNTVEQLWESVEAGKCGIDTITAFDTNEYRIKLAAQVKDLDVEHYFTKRDVKFNDRFTVFARVAAKQAIMDSNLNLEEIDRTQLGVIVGSGIGGLGSLENAKDNRNAKIYGEIVGYGTTCDANHITAPLEDGSMGALAMTLAIKDAKLLPENVDYINAHGTSTPLNDKTETLAVKRAFGDHALNLMMSSTKAMTGHMLGASGAVEAIISIKALQEGFVPATINLVNQDPLCDLDVVANVGRKKNINVAMSNSLGFGGHNASIVLKKWEG